MATPVLALPPTRSLNRVWLGVGLAFAILAVVSALLVINLLRPATAMSAAQLTQISNGIPLYPGSELVTTNSSDSTGQTLDESTVIPAGVEREVYTQAPLSVVAQWYSTRAASQGWVFRGKDSSTGAVLFTKGDLDLIVQTATDTSIPPSTATYSVIVSEAPPGCTAFPPPQTWGLHLQGAGTSAC